MQKEIQLLNFRAIQIKEKYQKQIEDQVPFYLWSKKGKQSMKQMVENQRKAHRDKIQKQEDKCTKRRNHIEKLDSIIKQFQASLGQQLEKEHNLIAYMKNNY